MIYIFLKSMFKKFFKVLNSYMSILSNKIDKNLGFYFMYLFIIIFINVLILV